MRCQPLRPTGGIRASRWQRVDADPLFTVTSTEVACLGAPAASSWRRDFTAAAGMAAGAIITAAAIITTVEATMGAAGTAGTTAVDTTAAAPTGTAVTTDNHL